MVAKFVVSFPNLCTKWNGDMCNYQNWLLPRTFMNVKKSWLIMQAYGVIFYIIFRPLLHFLVVLAHWKNYSKWLLGKNWACFWTPLSSWYANLQFIVTIHRMSMDTMTPLFKCWIVAWRNTLWMRSIVKCGKLWQVRTRWLLQFKQALNGVPPIRTWLKHTWIKRIKLFCVVTSVYFLQHTKKQQTWPKKLPYTTRASPAIW